MNGLVSLTNLFTRQLMGTIGYYLIYIHVALSAGTCLPYNQWKLIVQLPLCNFITYCCNQIPFFFRQYSQLTVYNGCSFFKDGKPINDLFRHGGRCANFKIVSRPFCLCSPILIGRYLYLTHSIFLNAVFHCYFLFELFTIIKGLYFCKAQTSS